MRYNKKKESFHFSFHFKNNYANNIQIPYVFLYLRRKYYCKYYHNFELFIFFFFNTLTKYIVRYNCFVYKN